MIAFAFYAAFIWYAAARWRRSWAAFGWVAAGAAGLVLVGFFHWKLNQWTNGRIYFRVLQTLLYPYSALVVGVGIFMACLPRRPEMVHCTRCAYDLRGLEGAAELCPECGATHPVLSPAPAEAPIPEVAPAPAPPRWPPIAEGAVCHPQADG